jgi:hypothetical protein
MSGNAELARKPGEARAEASARARSALDEAPSVRALGETAQLLNARPAAVAQRALGERLSAPAQRAPAPHANRTGLPDTLKSGIESLSGIAMDDVRVHRNSSAPAQLDAHAFAQGADIHVAPGQDHHLPHEAWHVVQQKQGRVKPTIRAAGGTPVNDDPGLEAEANAMGARAESQAPAVSAQPSVAASRADAPAQAQAVVQRALPPGEADTGGLYTPLGAQASNAFNGEARLGGGSFSAKFRKGMFDQWEGQGVASPVGKQFRILKCALTNRWAPEDGIQLDHKVSVDTIAGQLPLRANAIGAEYAKGGDVRGFETSYYNIFNRAGHALGWDASKAAVGTKRTKGNADKAVNEQRDLVAKEELKVQPTLYGSLSYFHDMPNLQPALGSANASKGAGPEAAKPSVHPAHDPSAHAATPGGMSPATASSSPAAAVAPNDPKALKLERGVMTSAHEVTSLIPTAMSDKSFIASVKQLTVQARTIAGHPAVHPSSPLAATATSVGDAASTLHSAVAAVPMTDVSGAPATSSTAPVAPAVATVDVPTADPSIVSGEPPLKKARPSG